MPKYVWLSGSIVEWENAKVHVYVHALHYGTAVFEGIRGYYVDDVIKVFRLKDHLKRLVNSAKILYMNIPYAIEDLEKVSIELVRDNDLHENIYIRPIAFRGLGEFGVRGLKSSIEVAILVIPLGKYLKSEKVKCMISSWRRPPNDVLPVEAKASGIYLSSNLAGIEAALSGYDEAIFLDYNGYVCEGSGENIFIVKNNVLITPPVYNSILEGITRNTVITLARDLGYTVIERKISRGELYTCDEAFFTGTAAEITPIVEVDHRVIGNGDVGEVTDKISKFFREVVSGRVWKYMDWITEVKLKS
ncbi:MAG: branched-chain amino acid transaminase [Candidatus Methanomethylicia archaeon]